MNASLISLNLNIRGFVLTARRWCCAMVLLCGGGVMAQQSGPWELVDSFPADIDLVAVVDNPAKALLSDEGQASRGFIGSIGLFGKTRQAWGSMAELLGTDADGVIEQLLSRRVVVVVDSLIEHTENPVMMINTADTNWVLMGEVAEGSDAFVALRKRLKPIPREIVSGVAVYGIEQGRYALVMLNPSDGQAGRLILCPKGGRDLLERVLESVKGAKAIAAEAPIPVWRQDSDWALALRVRADSWIERFQDQTPISRSHVRLFMGKSEEGVAMELAMPYRGNRIQGDAPIGMLDALAEDVVGAMATAGIFRLVLDQEEGLSILLRSDDPGDLEGTVLEPNGALMVFDGDDLRSIQRGTDSMGMTMLSIFDAGGVDASGMDAVIEPMVFEDTGSFPGVSQNVGGSYRGLFPKAVRTHEIIDQQGLAGNVSWLTSQRSATSDLIFSFGDTDTDTAKRVRSISELVASLDAIGGGEAQNAVIMKGYARIRALIDSLGASAWLGSKTKLDEMGFVRWEVVQEAKALRGSVRIEPGQD
jgi:hypothetical protein